MKQTLSDISVRAGAYQLLSQCYYLPDEELMRKIVDAAQADPLFAGLACHASAFVELEPLKVDYAALFVGPYKLLAPPYGSVYLEDNRVMGESTVDARNCYENEGLNVVLKEAPDHIAVELEFMYFLVSKQIETAEEADQRLLQSYVHKQRSFLRTHLGRWVSQFAQRMRTNAQTAFYRNLAELTEAFVRQDVNICA